jgi:hypothetical protein
MSNSSALLTSPWASLYFKPIPEGQIFTCPPPWIFGKQREYRLGNAQAEQLVTRLSRASWVGGIGMGAILIAVILGGMGISYMVAGGPDEFIHSHPIAFAIGLIVLTLLMISLYLVYFFRAAATLLAGLPWAEAAREPYSLKGNLKRTIAIETMFPTWLLAILAALFLIGIPLAGVPAIKALADGRATFELFLAVMFLVQGFVFGAALFAKLKRQRAVK